MDFKSLMSAQIARSKPKSTPSSSTKSPTPDTTSTATNKYLRRAESEAARQAEYLAEQERIQSEREERAAKKRKLEGEEIEKNLRREEKLRKLAEESKLRREQDEREEERKRRKRLGLPDLPDQKALDDGSAADGEAQYGVGENIPDDELRSKLRELNEPATLYDEGHTARLKRYHTLTHQKAVTTTSKQLTNGAIPTTLEPVPEKDLRLPETMPKPGALEHLFLHRQIASYFTLLLTEWSLALSSRSQEVKSSSTGKAAHAAYLTVLRDLTPLFRQLESATLHPSLLGPITKILRSTQSRRYVEANDEYLTLSIGKAAWPIGVTMVGIHERSAREKLHDGNNQAHIMSDEVTRKFLQSIKRCISFAQTRYPPEDLGQLMG